MKEITASDEKKKRDAWSNHPGFCAYCMKPIRFEDHGKCQETPPPETAWEIEHDIPETDEYWDTVEMLENDPRNLWPACCECNREKSNQHGINYYIYRLGKKKPLNKELYRSLLSFSILDGKVQIALEGYIKSLWDITD